MFFLGTIKRWLWNRSREVYIYWDGTKFRRADPLQVGSALERECPKYMEHLELLYKKSDVLPPGELKNNLLQQQKDAALELTAAARKIFQLPELTDVAGLTDGEAFRVLTGFFQLMEVYASEASTFR